MEKSITLTDRTQKKRIEWIDIAKGIGMVLVMLGHMQIPYSSPSFVNAVFRSRLLCKKCNQFTFEKTCFAFCTRCNY